MQRKQLNKLIFSLLTISILFFIVSVADAQCAMCKATLESSGAGKNDVASFGRGINDGIIYLMFIPYLLLFIVFRKKIKHFAKEIIGLWRV